MKRFFLLVTAVALSAASLSAQDVITRKNGEDIKAVVTEIGTTEIRYYKYDNLNGPVYSIPKSDVLMIRYENGSTETFSAGTAAATPSYGALVYPHNSDTPIVPGMKYRELKQIYDYRDYFPDYGNRYSPGWDGFASLMIPGLGQMICGETGRGLAFLAGGLAFASGSLYLGVEQAALYQRNAQGEFVLDSKGNLIITDQQRYKTLSSYSGILSIIHLGYCIWSCVDAVRVAKVKNMYYQDLRRGSYSLDIHPTMELAMTPSGMQPLPGLGVSLQF